MKQLMKVCPMLLLSAQMSYHLIAQVICTDNDVRIFNSVMNEAKKIALADSAIDRIVINVGRQFLGTPYVGGILDKPGNETMVVDLGELDCVTFLENVVALSVIIKENKTEFEDYCNELKYIRYRNGVLNGYESRLHYFYDWINDNQKKAVLENITAAIGGKPFEKNINFMTLNRKKYPHLTEDSSLLILKKVEEELSVMNKFYIPKEELSKMENVIHDGDLIALATSINGLDVEHVGIAIHLNNRLHLMHASSVNKKVEISKAPLCDMLNYKSTYAGIIVGRMK